MIQNNSRQQQPFDINSELIKDHSYADGTILSSMNTEAEESARDFFIQHLERNLGDPALFPGTQNIEAYTINILGNLFDLPSSGTGSVLTGGSEANITALWAIRNKMRSEISPDLHNKLEIIAPTSAHISINKAADLLGLKLNSIPVTSKYEMDRFFGSYGSFPK